MTAITVVDDIRQNLERMQAQFEKVLPAHVPPEKFVRVVMTAIQTKPSLVNAERSSLYAACMKAAEEGLLPDGKEGAIVPYKGTAKWLPMVQGIMKKARNSGEITKWELRVIKENDEFSYEQGDSEQIIHRPFFGDRGKTIGAYSIVTLRDGERSREVMTVEEIEAIRARSRAKEDGPWVTDYDEMCKKTVARRHSKTLPMSTDLERLVQSDDEDYELSTVSEEKKPATHSKRLKTVIDSVSEEKAEALPEEEKLPFEK